MRQAPPAWPHGDPRDVVHGVLADPRFVLRPPAPHVRSWFEIARDWLAGILRGLFHGLDRVLGANSRFDTALGFVVIGAALTLLGYAVYRLIRAVNRSGGRRSRVVPGAPSPEPDQTAAVLRGAALQAARDGRYRDAAALLFASATRALDERGRVDYDPARTPGEYRRLVRDPLFDALAADAVIALFAAAEPRDDLFERMNRSYDQFFEPARRS